MFWRESQQDLLVDQIGGKGKIAGKLQAFGLRTWRMVMPCTEVRRSCLGRKAKKSSLAVLFGNA